MTDQAMTELDPASEPQVSDAFSVHDEGSANWVVRKINEARAYGQRVAAWADREQARARHEEEWFLFRFRQQLLDWAKQQIAGQGGKRKSVNLPAGTLGFRKENMKIVVDDEGAVIAWAKQHSPQCVNVIERLSKSTLNEHVEQTGEIPDVGVHVEPAGEKFYVR